MEDILAEVKEKKNIDILELSKDVDVSNKSFKERAWINFLKKNYERTIWYYQQIKDMTEGKNASNLNDFDAAKEIMVGTIVGNYQKKLNSLKNITPAEFQKMKNEFKKTYETIHLVPEQGQSSLYSLFAEASFLDGLNDCKNPFDLVENFPLSGVLMKINKASIPNSVFEIQIQNIYDLKGTTDQTQVIKNNGAIILNENGQQYSVNCFLPLLTAADKVLVPLLKSSIFNIIMTYNLINDADQNNALSLEALLITSFNFLDKNQDEFSKGLKEKIL